MTLEAEIKVGSKRKFISQGIEEIVTITQSPIKNSDGYLEYGAMNEEGVYRICFDDELFQLEIVTNNNTGGTIDKHVG